ncbi:MAG: hypothetical protein QNJ31_08675 [Candidatus Caenarcaniphilales bacterium]|nr:hypothetical protein [Candidatus Caenarcaniphilales bacterium]
MSISSITPSIITGAAASQLQRKQFIMNSPRSGQPDMPGFGGSRSQQMSHREAYTKAEQFNREAEVRRQEKLSRETKHKEFTKKTTDRLVADGKISKENATSINQLTGDLDKGNNYGKSLENAMSIQGVEIKDKNKFINDAQKLADQ